MCCYWPQEPFTIEDASYRKAAAMYPLTSTWLLACMVSCVVLLPVTAQQGQEQTHPSRPLAPFRLFVCASSPADSPERFWMSLF